MTDVLWIDHDGKTYQGRVKESMPYDVVPIKELITINIDRTIDHVHGTQVWREGMVIGAKKHHFGTTPWNVRHSWGKWNRQPYYEAEHISKSLLAFREDREYWPQKVTKDLLSNDNNR